MKKIIITALLMAGLFVNAQGFQYKIVTTIESVVPGGIGRSRIIENGTEVDYTQFTTTRTKEGKEKTDKDRSDVKIDNLKESTLVNFYSLVGINFQNIASNDAMITSMLNKYSKDGWELFNIVSGVESDAGKGDGDGIFITRFYFRMK
ncbi:hypothetical protein [Flavobacterium ammonificans]|uniref:DUF4177 domain-containing protein n=1 Tax=Flavobacterium ammonificans TaxID=1751056 RepID=A0ABM7UYX5_9FLAO|nr:hypothetical protein [Flavobacterium ammonificans]BDB52802.1 hypothetical protein GENT11_11140 [Flavobacterium ammonificans]